MVVSDFMTEQAPSEQQVADYLSRHPDFFLRQAELLSELTLPHDSGEAVSLVERQVAILRERNMDMRHRLSKLLDNARDNDRLFDKTRRLVLALLEARSLEDALDALLHSFQHDFNIHYTSVLLFGREDALPPSAARVVTLGEAREHIGPVLKNNKPLCGALGEQETGFLFPDFADSVGSLALVPLLHGNTFGILAIANRDPDYYRSSMGTLFLSYIGEVLSRLLPRLMPSPSS